MDNDLSFWLWFHKVKGIKSNDFKLMESYFKTLQHAWSANKEELKISGLHTSIINEILINRTKERPSEEEERLLRYGIQAVTWNSKIFPRKLKTLPEPPPILYFKGDLSLLSRPIISIIGSKDTTAYAKEVTVKLVTDMIKHKYLFIGGLSKGVDTISHKTSLLDQVGTIGILPGGVDIIHPPENLDLARQIEKQGLLFSEHPVGKRSTQKYAVQTGRLITQMSQACILVESPETSDSLSIALNAVEQNIPLFAVPGNIFASKSRGPNSLIINRKAKPLIHFEDVTKYLRLDDFR